MVYFSIPLKYTHVAYSVDTVSQAMEKFHRKPQRTTIHQLSHTAVYFVHQYYEDMRNNTIDSESVQFVKFVSDLRHAST